MPVLPRNLKITDWVMSGDCVDQENTVRNDSLSLPHYFGCNQFGGLAVFNPLYGYVRRIKTTWPSPSIIEATNGLEISWTHPDTKTESRISLDGLIESKNGRIVFLKEIPAVLFVEDTAKSGFLQDLKKYLESSEAKDATVEWSPVPKDNNIALATIKGSTEKEGHIFTTHNVEAKVAAFSIIQDKGAKVQQIDFDILQAKVAAQLGTTYIGYEASVNLVGGKVSAFDATLGFGIGSGIGIRDEAIEIEALGCGFTVGKRIGISVFGNSIEINFGRFF